MIPADSITFNDDGTAWLVEEALPDSPSGWPATRNDYPCDTCGGGLEEAFQWRDWQTVSMIQDCPDCDGTGRHTFTVEVGGHSRTPSLSMELSGEAPCDGCVRTYRVSVVPGMVLRIISMSAACADDAPPLPFIISPVRRGEATVIAGYPDADHETVITLPPAAQPGMWAVKLRVEKI
jgi:hypothetical protein